MPTGVHRKIKAAMAGELPSLIARLPSGWVVAGDTQPLKGYCVLLADPVAQDFNALDEKLRARYAVDMGRVDDALIKVVGAYRVNYETWGNLDPALHTHIVPRFLSEPQGLRVQPPRAAYDWNAGRPFALEEDGAWMRAVRELLK